MPSGKVKPRPKLSLTPEQIRQTGEKMVGTPKASVAKKVPVDLQTYLKKAMTKEFSLTIAERAAAAKIFDTFKGGLSQLAAILDDVKGIIISEEEWAKVERVKVPVEGGGENWTWNPDLDEANPKVVSLSQEAVDYLKKEIKAKSDANEITLADKSLISLDKKINA